MRKSTCCSARIEINVVGVCWPVTDKLSWHPSTPAHVIAGSKIDVKPSLLNSSTDSDQPNSTSRSSSVAPFVQQLSRLSFLNLTAFGSLDFHLCTNVLRLIRYQQAICRINAGVSARETMGLITSYHARPLFSRRDQMMQIATLYISITESSSNQHHNEVCSIARSLKPFEIPFGVVWAQVVVKFYDGYWPARNTSFRSCP